MSLDGKYERIHLVGSEQLLDDAGNPESNKEKEKNLEDHQRGPCHRRVQAG
jgi:hypothetical protein